MRNTSAQVTARSQSGCKRSVSKEPSQSRQVERREKGWGVESMTEVERSPAGLWIAHGFNFLRHRATKRTVTLKTGERALVTVDDSGTVTQIETTERLDAVVRPRTVRIQLRRQGG